MVDTTDNGFRAAIQSLREIVLPAVDPAHPMAREQIMLVIDWLAFQRERNPMLAERQRAELGANLAIMRAIADLGLRLDPAGLTAAIVEAERTLADPATTYSDLMAARDAAEDALSAAVRSAASLPEADRDRVEQIVVRGSAATVALQRAWFLPYGLEADPDAIAPLDQVLDQAQHFSLNPAEDTA